MPTLRMSAQVFAIMSRLVKEAIGIHFGVSDQPIFEDKVATRAIDAGFESLLDYYYFLRYDPASGPELDALTDALVVGETYFFRELEQLEVMVDDYVTPVAETPRRVRIWTAACSTGEEPLTLAMLLADRGLLEKVEIVASDVSPRALARAQSGDVGRRALRHEGPLPAFAERWMTRDGQRVAVHRALREAVQWRRVNLVSVSDVDALGMFDFVVCRNVLIYFDDETTRRVIDNIMRVLRPGGALFVGISESLLRLDAPLEIEERRGVYAYRKVA